MHRYWDSVIKPVLEKQQVSNIVEIGCLYGDNTWKLAEYCQKKMVYCMPLIPFQNSMKIYLWINTGLVSSYLKI